MCNKSVRAHAAFLSLWAHTVARRWQVLCQKVSTITRRHERLVPPAKSNTAMRWGSKWAMDIILRVSRGGDDDSSITAACGSWHFPPIQLLYLYHTQRSYRRSSRQLDQPSWMTMTDDMPLQHRTELPRNFQEVVRGGVLWDPAMSSRMEPLSAGVLRVGASER